MKVATGAKAFHYTINGYLCALFLGLPLVVNQAYFNISATKSLYFLLISLLFCVLSLVLVLVSTIRNHRFPLTFIPLDIAVISTGLAGVISAGLSRFYLDVWLGRNSRLQGALILVLYVLLYLAVSNGLLCIRQKGRPVRFLVIGFVLVAGLAILHACNIDPTDFFIHLVPRQRHLFISTIGNVNFYSAYVCLCVPAFVVLSAHSEGKMSRICWNIVLVLSGGAMVLTCSESFVIGFAAFWAVTPFFFFGNVQRLVRFGTSLLVLLLSAGAFYYFHTILPNPIYRPAELLSAFLSGPWVWCVCVVIVAVCILVVRRPSCLRAVRWVYLGLVITVAVALLAVFMYVNIFGTNTAGKWLILNDRWGSGRGKVYRLCVEVLRDFSLKEWLFGVGPESLQNVMADRGVTNIDQAHSEYLHTLLTTGLCGLAAQLSTIALTVMAVVRRARHNPVAVALFAGLVSYWSQASVNIAQSFTTPLTIAFLAVIAGVYKQSANLKIEIKERKL